MPLSSKHISCRHEKMHFTAADYREKKLVVWSEGQTKKSDGPKKSYKYYPYGLQTANSWTRANTTGNNYLANGATEFNTTSSLYDLDYRNFDPVLGRMNGVDPMASKYASLTPYNFAFNDPVTFNDPSGADPNPGEPDFVTRRNLGTPCNCNNDFSRNYRGGSQMSIFEQGWSVGSGSLSAGSFAAADSYLAAANIEYGIGSALNSANGGSVNVATGKVSYYNESQSMIAGASYKDRFGTLTSFDALAMDLYFGNVATYAGIGWPQETHGRPGPIDIWNSNKSTVLKGLLSHLRYMGHNPDEAYNLRDIVKSFKEPVPWYIAWIPGVGGGNTTGGLGKIFGGNVQWFIGVAGNPNTDAWKSSKANMNLEMNGRARDGNNFIDGTPATIYQINVWGGSGNDRLIYINFLDKDIWNKTYNYLKGY
jgi:RHS repeat-associated protein